MAATLVQSKSAAVNTGSASNVVTWDTPATAGNLLLIVVAADDYRTAGGLPSGFTESTGCAQQGNHGLYVWWKVAVGGETSATYTLGSAATSVWETYEFSGIAGVPYDISAGQLINSGAATYTTPSITPTSGERLLVGVIGGSSSAGDFTGMTSWLNSFVGQLVVTNTKASGTRDIAGLATRSVAADGATGYSTGATYSPNATARTGITLAFKVAAAGGATTHVGAASGASVSTGSAAVTLLLVAAASGVSASAGAADAGRLMAAAASGASVSAGSAAATVVAAGPVTHQAAAAGTSASGGSASLVLRITAAAAGASTSTGPAAPVSLLAAAASGGRTSSGSAVATVFGQVVLRPNAGTTARPGSGSTARPFTGVTVRP